MKRIFWLFIWCLSAAFFIAYPSSAGTISPSGLTVQHIMDRAKVHLDASDDTFYTSADFIQWIDEAQKDISARTRCLEGSSFITITLVANTTKYTVANSYYLGIISVEHDNNDTTDPKQVYTLDRVRKEDIGHNNSTGRPQVYCEFNTYIEIWPPPRTSEVGTKLYVYWHRSPIPLTAVGNALETPGYFDLAIVYYNVAMAHHKNNKPDKAAYFMALYEKRVAEYSAIVQQRDPLK